MKRALFASLAAVLFVVLGAASPSAEGVVTGLKAGLSIAKITGSDAGDADWRTAGALGAFLTYRVNDIFAVQPELLYAMKGAETEGVEDFGDGLEPYKATMKLDYIEIPLLAVVSVPTQVRVKPFVYAGPALAFNISSSGEVRVRSVSFERDVEGIKSVDLGIVAGAGFEYRFESGSILFDARYDAGIVSIDDTVADEDVKNGAVSIMIGYGIAF